MQAIVGQSCRVTFTDDGQWLVTGNQQWFIFLLDSISGGFRGAQEIASFENGRFHVKQTFQSLPLGSMLQMWPQMTIRQICWTTKDALPPMTDTGFPALHESTSRLKPLRTPKQVDDLDIQAAERLLQKWTGNNSLFAAMKLWNAVRKPRGSCALQECLHKDANHAESLAQALLFHARHLDVPLADIAQDQHGNFCLQLVLCLTGSETTGKLFDALLPQAISLAKDSRGCRFLQCAVCGNNCATSQAELGSTFLKHDINTLLKDRYANFVVQTLVLALDDLSLLRVLLLEILTDSMLAWMLGIWQTGGKANKADRKLYLHAWLLLRHVAESGGQSAGCVLEILNDSEVFANGANSNFKTALTAK
ncbi:unnamed protein product, partial [Symbiodinium sp. CCMP2592]